MPPPQGDGGLDDGGAATAASFDPVALTDELWMRVVTPTLAAGALFRDYPYLSRLFTARGWGRRQDRLHARSVKLGMPVELVFDDVTPTVALYATVTWPTGRLRAIELS